MQGKFVYGSVMVTAVVIFSLLGSAWVQAGSKDLVAGKRAKFQDDSVESMRDVFMRREVEDKEYKEKVLANGEESLKILKEIRDLLRQLNEARQ